MERKTDDFGDWEALPTYDKIEFCLKASKLTANECSAENEVLGRLRLL